MSEPRTEAGRLLLHSTETQDDGTWSGFDFMRYRETVLAIEAEAAALERERLRKAAGQLSTRSRGAYVSLRDVFDMLDEPTP